MPDPQVEQWRGLVAQYFPPNMVDTMLWVMAHESGGIPTKTDYLGSGHNGLFQVAGGSFDPATNIQQAAALSQSAAQQRGANGLEPWGGGLNTNTTTWGPLSANNVATFAARGDAPPPFVAGGSQPVAARIGASPAAPEPVGPNGRTASQIRGTPYQSPEERDFYFQQQGTQPPQLAQQAQPAAATETLGPNGRSFSQITGGAYQSPEERLWYLNQIGKTVDANGNVVDATSGGGRAAPRIGVSSDVGDTGAQAGGTPDVPAPATPSFYGTAQPSAGNQTTLNNATAQAQMDQNIAYQQQATQQQAAPAISQNGLGQTVPFGYSGTSDFASNPQYGGGENGEPIVPQMRLGGSAIAGRAKKKKGLEPILPVGAPFSAPAPTAPAMDGDVNMTPGVAPVAMPVGMQPGGFNDAMPVGRALDSYWTPQQYGGGGTTTVGPGSVRAPEEIVAIGVQSGRPYFTAGEAGPEKVTIKPMQDGGTATVGDLDPNDPRNAAFGGGTVNATPIIPTIPQYNITPPTGMAQYGNPTLNQFNAQNNVYSSRQGEIGASQGVINANTGVLDAQGRTIPAQQGVIDAQGRVLDAQGNVIPYSQAVINAQRATIGPQGAYIDAQGNVIGAQEQQTAGERGYIGQQQGANAQSQAEEAAYQAATHNLPDLAATGAAQSYQDSTDYLYRLGGVVPAEVDTRGEALPAGSPTNVRAKIQSQADILKANNADAQKMRALQLEGARLAVALLGTNVDAAREAAARVGLTVDAAKLLVQQAGIEENQAQLGVTQAQLAKGYANNTLDQSQLGVTQAQLTKGYAANALDQAQLGTSQASLDLSRSNQPPSPGMVEYINPYTGEGQWVTPAQKAQLEANIGPSSPTAAQSQKAQVPKELEGLTVTQIVNLYVSGQIDKSVMYAGLAAKGVTSKAAADHLVELEHESRPGTVVNPAYRTGATGSTTSTGSGGIDVSGLTPR